MDILCQFSIKMRLIDDKKGCLFGCKYLLNLTYEIPWLSSHYLWCFYHTHVHYQWNADLKMTLKFFEMREDSFLNLKKTFWENIFSKKCIFWNWIWFRHAFMQILILQSTVLQGQGGSKRFLRGIFGLQSFKSEMKQ